MQHSRAELTMGKFCDLLPTYSTYNVSPVFLNNRCNNLPYSIAYIFNYFLITHSNLRLKRVMQHRYVNIDQYLLHTHVLCKLMESVFKDQLLSRLVSKGLINKQISTWFYSWTFHYTNLLECTHDWSIAFHGKQHVDVILISVRCLTAWFTLN